jgi:hypothetical protein
MTATDRAKKLTNLLAKLEAPEPAPAQADMPENSLDDRDPVLREFLRSFLVWESTTPKAEAALRRIDAACVDINEFRVSLVEEMVAIIGPGYARAEDRCARLKAALNDIYRREHRVRLAHLQEKNKRDAKAYLESIAQAPGFVASRTMLLALDGHAVPCDERLAARLVQADVLEPGTSAEEAAAWLERHVRSGESRSAYLALQAWADEGSTVTVKAGKPRPRRVKASPAKRTTAKPARKGPRRG